MAAPDRAATATPVDKPLPPLPTEPLTVSTAPPPAAATAAVNGSQPNSAEYESLGGSPSGGSSLRAVYSMDIGSQGSLPSLARSGGAGGASPSASVQTLRSVSIASPHVTGIPGSPEGGARTSIGTSVAEWTVATRKLVDAGLRALAASSAAAASDLKTGPSAAQDVILPLRSELSTAVLDVLGQAANAADDGSEGGGACGHGALREALQLLGLLNVVSILQTTHHALADPASTAQDAPLASHLNELFKLLQTELARIEAFGTAEGTPALPAPPLLLSAEGSPSYSTGGDRVKLANSLTRLAQLWAEPESGLARDVAITVRTDVLAILRAMSVSSSTNSSTGSLAQEPPSPSGVEASRDNSASPNSRWPARFNPGRQHLRQRSSDLIEMIAKLNRQLDNQRYTMTDKKAQHLEMSALLANVDRLNHGRLEDQRSPSPRELRERRIDLLEKYLERQRRGSFDNQRVELSEEQLLEMSAADLARYVENMHAMRLQDQSAPPPQERRDSMLNTVANVVERMHSMSMDDQRFVISMAERLEMSPESLRQAISHK